MEFDDRQKKLKANTKALIRERGLDYNSIAEKCSSISDKVYLSRILSTAKSGLTLKEDPHIREISKAIGRNESLFWEGLENQVIVEQHIEHGPDYARTPLNIEEFIRKNKKVENLDEFDERFLKGIYSRGSELERVSEESIKNLLKGFRESAKEEYIRGQEKNNITHAQILDAFFYSDMVGLAILMGEDLVYTRINKFLADMNGYSIEYHIGKKLKDVLPDAVNKLIPDMKKILKNGKPMSGRDFKIYLPNEPNKLIHLIDYLFPIFDNYENVIGVGSMVLHVTEITEKLVKYTQEQMFLEITNN